MSVFKLYYWITCNLKIDSCFNMQRKRYSVVARHARGKGCAGGKHVPGNRGNFVVQK